MKSFVYKTILKIFLLISIDVDLEIDALHDRDKTDLALTTHSLLWLLLDLLHKVLHLLLSRFLSLYPLLFYVLFNQNRIFLISIAHYQIFRYSTSWRFGFWLENTTSFNSINFYVLCLDSRVRLFFYVWICW